MSLADDVAAVLPELRAQAEARMTDTVRIARGGTPVFDETTGTYTPGTTTVYEGPCRLKLSSSVVSDLDAQGQLLVQQGPRLDLPIASSGAVRPGDTATITGSVNDPSSIGTVLTVSGRFVQTDATARRLPVELHS